MKTVFKTALSLLLLASLAACGGGNNSGPSTPTQPGSGSYSNASLKGSYVFALTGSGGSGVVAIAGVIQADGNGNITSGTLDENTSGGVLTNVPFGGTYQMNADGHGVANIQLAGNKFSLDFVLTSPSHGLLIRSDSNGVGSGTIDLQDPNALNVSALSGGYVFSLSGIDSNGFNLNEAGAFTNDGAGNVTSGVKDINDGGIVTTALPMNGTYSVSSNGRGTFVMNASSGTLTFASYVISAKQWKLIEIDPAPVLAGDVYQQAAGTLTNANFNGGYVFVLGGNSGLGPFTAGGQFNADGNGNLTSGTEDVNNAGSVSFGGTLTGNYLMGANGRATMTLTAPSGAVQMAAYPTITGRVVLMEIDNNANAGGEAFPQQAVGAGTSAIKGVYVLNYNGVLSNGEIDTIAKVTADGNGNFSGFEDANYVGSFSTYSNFTGTYAQATPGRFTGTITNSAGSAQFVYYVASSSEVLLMDVDNNQVDVGEMQLQTQQ